MRDWGIMVGFWPFNWSLSFYRGDYGFSLSVGPFNLQVMK